MMPSLASIAILTMTLFSEVAVALDLALESGKGGDGGRRSNNAGDGNPKFPAWKTAVFLFMGVGFLLFYLGLCGLCVIALIRSKAVMAWKNNVEDKRKNFPVWDGVTTLNVPPSGVYDGAHTEHGQALSSKHQLEFKLESGGTMISGSSTDDDGFNYVIEGAFFGDGSLYWIERSVKSTYVSGLLWRMCRWCIHSCIDEGTFVMVNTFVEGRFEESTNTLRCNRYLNTGVSSTINFSSTVPEADFPQGVDGYNLGGFEKGMPPTVPFSDFPLGVDGYNLGGFEKKGEVEVVIARGVTDASTGVFLGRKVDELEKKDDAADAALAVEVKVEDEKDDAVPTAQKVAEDVAISIANEHVTEEVVVQTVQAAIHSTGSGRKLLADKKGDASIPITPSMEGGDLSVHILKRFGVQSGEI